MAARWPLVVAAGSTQELPAGDTVPAAALPAVQFVVQAATVSSGSTHTTDATAGSYVDLTLSGTTASIGLPTGGVNRQTIEYAMRNTNAASCVVTFNSSIRLSTGLSTRAFTIPTGEFLYAAVKYSTINSGTVWTLVAATVSAT